MTVKNIIETLRESRLLALLVKKEKSEAVTHVPRRSRLSIQEEDIRYSVGEVYWEVE